MDLIKIACYRTTPYWSEAASEDLATAIVQPAATSPLTLTLAFQQAIAAGAVFSELAQMWKFSHFIEVLRAALHDGDLAGVQNMIASGALMKDEAGSLIWSQATTDALNAVVANNSLRLIDVVAAELGEDAPESVSAADVDAALGRN
jgi:hypothetical protein